MAFPAPGTIVTFTAAKGSLALGLPAPVDSVFDPVAQTVAGTVVRTQPAPPHGPGAIPNAYVTVQGRSGKQVTIDAVACHLRTWASWDEALAEVARLNRATRQGLSAPVRPSR